MNQEGRFVGKAGVRDGCGERHGRAAALAFARRRELVVADLAEDAATVVTTSA